MCQLVLRANSAENARALSATEHAAAVNLTRRQGTYSCPLSI